VLVQLVIAAITTSPWSSSTTSPSASFTRAFTCAPFVPLAGGSLAGEAPGYRVVEIALERLVQAAPRGGERYPVLRPARPRKA